MSEAFRTRSFAAAIWSILLLADATVCDGQISTGLIEGRVEDQNGRALPGAAVEIRGHPDAFSFVVTAGRDGQFTAVVTEGEYELRVIRASGRPPHTVRLHVPPLQTIHCVLGGDAGMIHDQPLNRRTEYESDGSSGGLWHWHSGAAIPLVSSLPALLLTLDSSSVTEPLDFSGVQNPRRWMQSQRTYSWTGATYRISGMDTTDGYQPGQTLLIPDLQAIDEVTVRSGMTMGAAGAFASETGVFMRQASEQWHSGLASTGTSSALASDNLPSPETRGHILQPELFNWLTRDNLQTSGPISKRADVFLSGSGQWSSQTVPIATRGQDQREMALFGNARGRYQLTSRDQFDAQYSGTLIRVPQWGQTTAVEALFGQRMYPPIEDQYGYSAVRESDSYQSFQAGWNRTVPMHSDQGNIEVRYQRVAAHLDSTQDVQTSEQSHIELVDGQVTGPAPLTNDAERIQHDLEGVFILGRFRKFSLEHQIVTGGGLEYANMRNRFSSPSNLNLITSSGIPAYVVELDTPVDSRGMSRSISTYLLDRIRVTSFLSLDLGVRGEFLRGFLPSQSVASGATHNTSDAISWNNVVPHAAFSLNVPGVKALSLGGAYRRTYAPMAGRYLDFGSTSSLSGNVYQWNDLNGDGTFQSNEQGLLLRRFGGAYSSISQSLARPYADQFNVAAQVRLPWGSDAGIMLYRRDEKDRIAAVNVGVGPQDYTPRVIVDPGPDSIFGTFDDSPLLVWNQQPSSFGQDQYLLTNPKGLRMLYSGFVAQAGTRHRLMDVHASFAAVKSYGPTNPGNGVLANDAGVVGALYQDPNTLINAAGRDFFDRAYLGKVQTELRLPVRWGGCTLTNIADYLDGLVFARQLLVFGLDQGPFLVGATVRGSPEGGNRAEYVLNWNLRLSRAFQMSWGRLELGMDVVNVMNANNRIRESDVTGPAFNLRLPVAIQPSRFVGFGFQFEF